MSASANDIPEIYRELDYFPEKIHIRGVDNLTTEDITAFASEHYPSQAPSRIEWIDDTSANIVYPTKELAAEALRNYAAEGQSDTISPDEIREAKRLSSQPFTVLGVRPAKKTDVKKPRAHEASRFYLLNPDKDPRENRRRYDGRFRPRGRDGARFKRSRAEDSAQFDVNMYDDDEDSLAKRRTGDSTRRESRSSLASDDSRRTKRLRSGRGFSGDLFSGRLEKEGRERLRDRSASPATWNVDGRFGFEEDDAGRVELRRESPPTYRKHGPNGSNAGVELLASPARGRSNAIDSTSVPNGRELFPSRSSPLKERNRGKELLSRSGSVISNHRRTDAFDYSDDTVELYDRTNGASVQLKEGSAQKGLKSRSLADRITGGPLKRKAENQGRDAEGFSIRGTAGQEESPGFAIKGVAKGVNPRVRELFPERDGNSGKELFGGSRAPRKKAEDLFS